MRVRVAFLYRERRARLPDFGFALVLGLVGFAGFDAAAFLGEGLAAGDRSLLRVDLVVFATGAGCLGRFALAALVGNDPDRTWSTAGVVGFAANGEGSGAAGGAGDGGVAGLVLTGTSSVVVGVGAAVWAMTPTAFARGVSYFGRSDHPARSSASRIKT